MKPLLLTGIVVALLALAADASAGSKKRLDFGDDAHSEAADGYEEVLSHFAALPPEQRKERLESLLVSGAPDKGVELLGAATPDVKGVLLEAIAQTVHDVISRPVPRSMEDNQVLMNCAGLLRAASDDHATVAAFAGNLTKLEVWAVEHYALEALSSCRDSRAVELMAGLARARIGESNQWLAGLSLSASEEQRAAADKAASLFSAIRGLARSANNSGKAIARPLRDEFVKLFDGSPYRGSVLREIEAEIDPLIRAEVPHPHPGLIVPFALMLLAIALMPFIHRHLVRRTKPFWRWR